jgi:predicted TIM-barrel fold metal-dependent hydrolase
MIVDIHGHTNAPPSLYAYKAGLTASRGAHGKGNPGLNEEAMANAVKNHLVNNLDKVGTDVQFLSPRPFQLMHSEKPEKIVHYWVQANNDAIAMSVKLAPTRYRGVAGLPQCAGVPIINTFDEIDRCVNDLGFVGIMINPDPNEGSGTPTPGMGDEYWYPLYEKMVQLDIPALIHSASCKDPWDTYSNYFITTETRTIISMVSSATFDKFPKLKIIVSHGGGAVPYQVGRYRAFFGRHLEGSGGFDLQLKKFYFDTVLYNPEPSSSWCALWAATGACLARRTPAPVATRTLRAARCWTTSSRSSKASRRSPHRTARTFSKTSPRKSFRASTPSSSSARLRVRLRPLSTPSVGAEVGPNSPRGGDWHPCSAIELDRQIEDQFAEGCLGQRRKRGLRSKLA